MFEIVGDIENNIGQKSALFNLRLCTVSLLIGHQLGFFDEYLSFEYGTYF